MINLINVIGNGIRAGSRFVVQHGSAFLMGTGTVGAVSSVIFAVKATPAAEKAIEEAKEELGKDELTFAEKAKAGWTYYIPAAGMLAIGVGSFWFAHHIDVKKQMMLASLYTTAETALTEYQQKVVEMIGEKGETEIRNALAKDKVDKLPPPQEMQGIEDTNMICMIDNQYFRSNYRKVKMAEANANLQMIQDMWISKRDVYDLLDPDGVYLKSNGHDGMLGWNLDRTLVLDARYVPGDDGDPVLVIEYMDDEYRHNPPTVTGYSLR